ncbi:MAG: hypothetical protein WEE53_06105 [Acidimicrobiia bacterium]
MATVHVLLVYDLVEGRLIATDQFSDSGEAMARYAEAEREHLRDSKVEVVLVGADSLDTIRQTHASYFSERMSLEDIAKALLV